MNCLFQSSCQMNEAYNYNSWTFSLFQQYLRGDVLEIGCGVGSFTRLISKITTINKLLSIDISPDAVQQCSKIVNKQNIKIQCKDLMDVQGEFDTIICMNVLEHIKNDSSALQHLVSCLKPKATLFLLVPAHMFLFTPFDVAAGHFRRYNKNSINSLLRDINTSTNVDIRSQFYFNIVGALGYGMVYKAFRKIPESNTSTEIGIFDKYVVPIMEKIESKQIPFGLSLCSVIKRI